MRPAGINSTAKHKKYHTTHVDACRASVRLICSCAQGEGQFRWPLPTGEQTVESSCHRAPITDSTCACAVYKAVNVRTGVSAAVKAVNAAKIGQKKLLHSLQTEIDIQRGINHPNTVKLIDNIYSQVR